MDQRLLDGATKQEIESSESELDASENIGLRARQGQARKF